MMSTTRLAIEGRHCAVAATQPARIYVDQTHCGRHTTGLERIALELFSPAALAPLQVTPIRAAGRLSMMARQTVGLPMAALRDRTALYLCPGFPPSPLLTLFGGRILPYIHDAFLITRAADLNIRAKLYMAWPFRLALRRLPRFLVNSQSTRDELRKHCRPDADITLYRPRIGNVFGLEAAGRRDRAAPRRSLRLIALGTVEPRKNLRAAAAIVAALRAKGFDGATLDIVGRLGWERDVDWLRAQPGVTLHGYQSTEAVRELIEASDLLISTSHDEGLGLPLLEAQYAGIAVAAPDKAVFREVLGASGIVIDPADPRQAAARIAACAGEPNWQQQSAAAASANLERWNAAAASDRTTVVELITTMAGGGRSA